jgi:putative flippase GtrA
MKTDSFGTFARFLTSGTILNLIGLLLFSVLIATDVKGENATIIVSLILLPIAFLSNKKIVFRDGKRSLQTKYRFVLIYLLIVACNYLYLRFFLQIFHAPELIAQVFFLSVVVVISFLVQKLWVFRLDSKK